MSERGASDDEMLRQLEQATRRGVRLNSLDDPEAAALNEGWRALNQALSQGMPRTSGPALVHRVLQETHRRETRRRRVRWAVAIAASVLLASVGLSLIPRPVAQVVREVPVPKRTAPEVIVPDFVPDTVPEVVPRSPEYVVGTEEAPADPWTETDDEIAVAWQGVDDLQDRWNISNTYLEYVAQKFDEMETALAMLEL